MYKEMPELEAGMVIEYKWRNAGLHEYLSLGGDRTIDLGCDDRSQPLKGIPCGEITKVYSSKNLQSLNDCKGESRFSSRTLIWEKKVRTETDIKIEQLEKTIAEAQEQLQGIKSTIKKDK